MNGYALTLSSGWMFYELKKCCTCSFHPEHDESARVFNTFR